MKNNIKLPDIKVPRFLSDLFGDLRDRRLLPLIAVLAVGIVVVPFALSSSSPKPDASLTPSGQIASSGSPLAELEVVSNESGLRDYRRRLGGDPKEPFNQLFTSPVLGGSELGDGATGPSTEIGGGESGTPGGPTTPVDPAPEGTDLPPGGEEEPTLPPVDEDEPPYVVSLRAGPPEDMKEQKLSEPTILPSEDNPLLIFNGPDGKGGKAIFRVTSEVNAIYGDAECLKGTDRCERLAVQVGDTITVLYGDENDERAYRLTVVDIDRNR